MIIDVEDKKVLSEFKLTNYFPTSLDRSLETKIKAMLGEGQKDVVDKTRAQIMFES